jgi:hypothetical protein
VREQDSLDPNELSDLTVSREFRALSHAFVRAVVLPHLDYVPYVQKGAYVRVHRNSQGTPFHSDALLGHGLEEENLWIALTPARLYLVPPDRIRAVGEDFLERCRALAVPFDLDPGQALLFTSQHIHGVLPADQITVDFRITPRINPHAILGCLFEELD